MSLGNKKKIINYHFKGLYKTTYYKTKPSYSQLFFPQWLLYECFFCFFYQSVCKYHWQAFIGYKNGENLKILIKVFCDKLIVSGVILTFLDHVKAKIFFVIQPWWLIYSTPSTLFWKSLDPPLYVCLLFHILVFNNIFDQCLFCCYEKFFLHEKVVKIKKWLALNLPLTSLFSNVL